MHTAGCVLPSKDDAIFYWEIEAAKQGHLKSILDVAEKYHRGVCVPENTTVAGYWFLEAAKQNNPVAQLVLSDLYLDGTEGHEQDDTKALYWLRRGAEHKRPFAENRLGWAYEFGKCGLTKDPEMAKHWYLLAAKQSYYPAQYNLAFLILKSGQNGRRGEGQKEKEDETRGQCHSDYSYQQEQGLTQEAFDEAIAWMRSSASGGHIPAQLNLAWRYMYGKTRLPQDDAEALVWYSQAAASGDTSANAYVGWIYEKGILPCAEKHIQIAVQHYRLAAQQNNTWAQSRLGTICRNGYNEKDQNYPPNFVEAHRWLRAAADKGDVTAQVELGLMYLHGEGVDKDYVEAMRLHRKAAEAGNAAGQCNMGFMYHHGYGVERDDTEAVAWYRKAAEQGHGEGQNYLGWMYVKGYGVQQNDSEAVYWLRKAADQSDMHGM
ncbi:hypothetical protein BGZ73_001509, partial [Actinomortierella ambigua]